MAMNASDMRRALGKPHMGVVAAAYVLSESSASAGSAHRELGESDRIKASLTVYNVIAERTGGVVSTPEFEQVWNRIAATDKLKLAQNSGNSVGIVMEAMRQDPLLAAKANLAPAASDLRTTASATDTGFFDGLGRTPFDRRSAPTGVAGTYAGTSNYVGLAGANYDPAKGWATLTPANFAATEFARAGLDYSTTMRLAAQGFSPAAIKHAASFSRELGLDAKENAEPIAHLQKNVKGIEKPLRDIKTIQDSIDKLELDAHEARKHGDMKTADRLTREANELRQTREEKVDYGEKLVKKQSPEDMDNYNKVIKGLVGKDKEIEADLKAGRITQDEANRLRLKSTKKMGDRDTADLIAEAKAEKRNESNPNATTPARVADLKETIKTEIKTVGDVAAQAETANMFDDLGGSSKTTASQSDKATKAKPDTDRSATKQSEKNVVEAKPAETKPQDQKKKITVASNGMGARV